MNKRVKILITLLCLAIVGYFVAPLFASTAFISTEQAKREDTAHVSGAYGLPSLGVRLDSAASLAGASGDYTLPIYDSTNRLWVNAAITSGGISGVTYAEDSIHTTADDGVFILGLVNSIPTTLAAEGDYTALAVNATGMLWINDSSYVSEDSAFINAQAGYMAYAVRVDTLTAGTGADGDISALLTNVNGALHSVLTSVEVTEDATAGDGYQGLNTFPAVRNDGPTTLVGADGDLTKLSVDSSGMLWIRDYTNVKEDDTHNSGERGYLSFGVRNDVLATLVSADGDLSLTQYDSEGAAWVNVHEAIARTTGTADAQAGATVSTSISANSKLKYVLVALSAAQTPTITVTINSGTGAGYDTLLSSTSVGAGDTSLFYLPAKDIILMSDDEIDVNASGAGGACTASITIITETI